LPKKISQNSMGCTSVNNMLNFSRLSRRTHRMVNALISCQYSVTIGLQVRSSGERSGPPYGPLTTSDLP
jgi:hypothetical protein